MSSPPQDLLTGDTTSAPLNSDEALVSAQTPPSQQPPNNDTNTTTEKQEISLLQSPFHSQGGDNDSARLLLSPGTASIVEQLSGLAIPADDTNLGTQMNATPPLNEEADRPPEGIILKNNIVAPPQNDVDTIEQDDDGLGGLSDVDTELDFDEEPELLQLPSRTTSIEPTIIPPPANIVESPHALSLTSSTVGTAHIDQALQDEAETPKLAAKPPFSQSSQLQDAVAAENLVIVEESSTTTTSVPEKRHEATLLKQPEAMAEAANATLAESDVEEEEEDDDDEQPDSPIEPPLPALLSVLPAFGPLRFNAALQLERSLTGRVDSSFSVVNPAAFGDTNSNVENGGYREDDRAYRQDIWFASLVSQLDEVEESSRKTSDSNRGESFSDKTTGDNQPKKPTSSSTGGGSTSQSEASSGVCLGTRAVARSFLSPPLEPLFHGKQGAGVPSCTSKFHGMVAVGTTSGSVHVLMPPAGKVKGPPRLCDLIDKSVPSNDGVTSLCLGQQHSGSLLVLAGHASGVIRLWDLKAQATGNLSWSLAKTITGMHASPITSTTILDSAAAGTTWGLSSDAHGRLVAHNVNRHLSLTAQALAGLARQFGGSSGPPPSSVITVEAAGQDPGMLCSISPLRAPLVSRAQPVAAGIDAGGQVYIQDLGHPVLIAATRAVLLCMLSPEGKLSVLHIFLPPRTAQPGAYPYVAWSFRPTEESGSNTIAYTKVGIGGGDNITATSTATIGSSSTSTTNLSTMYTQSGVASIVSVAWGANISAYRAVLSYPTGLIASSGASVERALPLPAVLGSWSAQAPVQGLAFFDTLITVNVDASRASSSSQASQGLGQQQAGLPPRLLTETLVVVTSQGDNQTGLTLYQVGELLKKGSGGIPALESESEHITIPDWVVGRQYAPAGTDESAFHNALACWGEQALVLTSKGACVLQLLTWQQRLSALLAAGKTESALLSALRLHRAAASAFNNNNANHSQLGIGGNIVSSGQESRSSVWPAETAELSQAAEISRTALTILCAYLDSKLGTTGSGNNNNNKKSPLKIPVETLSIAATVAVYGCLLLGSTDALSSLIYPRFQSAGVSGALLEVLEGCVANGELETLSPEVVQALVEHFVAVGHPERMEQCVLKMNVASLDLNQVIPLCIKHRMYSALIHVFTRALKDYQTPASLILVAAALSEEEGGKNQKGDQQQDEERSLRLGYKLLVYLKCCLAGEQFPPGSGSIPLNEQAEVRAHAVTFLLHSTTASILDCWSLWAEVTRATSNKKHSPPSLLSLKESSGSNKSLEDPHPALRYLVSLDPECTLNALSQGLTGWDALESELAEVSPEIAPLIPKTGRTVTQAAVDAVCDLLLLSTKTLPSSEVVVGGFGSQDKGDEESRIQKEESVLTGPILRFVARHLASNRAVAPPGFLFKVLTHLTSSSLSSSSGTAESIGESISASEEQEATFRDVISHAAPSMTDEERWQAISLARKAGFLQAEARIRHIEHNHIEALRCVCQDVRYPQSAFKYARDVLQDLAILSEPEKWQAFQDAIVKFAPQLVKLNALETARMVSELLSSRQLEVLESLGKSDEEGQFLYLQAALEVAHEEEREGNNILIASTTTSGSNTHKPRSKIKPAAAENSMPITLKALLSDMAVSSLYVKLLCRHQPTAVLPYLQSHDTYSVDECLRHCLAAKVQDGAAFLMERRGDVQSALSIYLDTLDEANRSVVEATVDRDEDGVKEMDDAKEAARAAIAMCIRFSQDHVAASSSSSTVAATKPTESQDAASAKIESGQEEEEEDPVQRVWFELLQRYLIIVRSLRTRQRTSQDEKERSRLEKVQAVFGELLEEVIGQMASHVPLRSIADSIIRKYGSDHFGDFKNILMSLLGACNFELAILRCARRVVGSDTIDLLKSSYRECMAPQSAEFLAANGADGGTIVD